MIQPPFTLETEAQRGHDLPHVRGCSGSPRVCLTLKAGLLSTMLNDSKDRLLSDKTGKTLHLTFCWYSIKPVEFQAYFSPKCLS